MHREEKLVVKRETRTAPKCPRLVNNKSEQQNEQILVKQIYTYINNSCEGLEEGLDEANNNIRMKKSISDKRSSIFEFTIISFQNLTDSYVISAPILKSDAWISFTTSYIILIRRLSSSYIKTFNSVSPSLFFSFSNRTYLLLTTIS